MYNAPRDRFLGGDLERDGLIELHRDGSITSFAEEAPASMGECWGSRLISNGSCSGVWRSPRLSAAAGDTTQAPARSIVFALELPSGRLVRRVPPGTEPRTCSTIS